MTRVAPFGDGRKVSQPMSRRSSGAAEMTVRQRFCSVPIPEPVLSRERKEALTARQREILDRLVVVFEGGFADLTMLSLAKQLNCSLRTLYTLATTRDELMLVIVEHFITRTSSVASDAITDEMTALEALRTYLSKARSLLDTSSREFARDVELVPGVEVFVRRHLNYRFEVIRALLDLAVERGEIRSTDNAALAHVMARVAWEFTRPEVWASLATSPKKAHDFVIDVIIHGLRVAPARDTTAAHQDHGGDGATERARAHMPVPLSRRPI